MRALCRAALRFMARRSSSDRPPQTPESWPLSSAHCKQASRTSHFIQTFFASSICAIAGPVFPTGKKSSGSTWRHAARWRQSMFISVATKSLLYIPLSPLHSRASVRLRFLAFLPGLGEDSILSRIGFILNTLER